MEAHEQLGKRRILGCDARQGKAARLHRGWPRGGVTEAECVQQLMRDDGRMLDLARGSKAHASLEQPTGAIPGHEGESGRRYARIESDVDREDVIVAGSVGGRLEQRDTDRRFDLVGGLPEGD